MRFLYTARKQRAWSRERVDRGWKRAKGKSESQKKKDERNDEAVVKREALHAFQSCSNLHRGNEEGVCLPSRRMLYPLYSHTLHPFSSCSSSLYAERGNRDPWISKASWLYERALFFGTPFNPNFNPLKSQRLLKIKGYQRHVIGLSLLFNYFLCENIFSETFMWKYPQKSLQPFSIFFLKSVSTSWTHWNSMWKHLQHDQKWEKIQNFNIKFVFQRFIFEIQNFDRNSNLTLKFEIQVLCWSSKLKFNISIHNLSSKFKFIIFIQSLNPKFEFKI